MRRFPDQRVETVLHELLNAHLHLPLDPLDGLPLDRELRAGIPEFKIVAGHSLVLMGHAVHDDGAAVADHVLQRVDHFGLVRQADPLPFPRIHVDGGDADKEGDPAGRQEIRHVTQTVRICHRIDVFDTDQRRVGFFVLLVHQIVEQIRKQKIPVGGAGRGEGTVGDVREGARLHNVRNAALGPGGECLGDHVDAGAIGDVHDVEIGLFLRERGSRMLHHAESTNRVQLRDGEPELLFDRERRTELPESRVQPDDRDGGVHHVGQEFVRHPVVRIKSHIEDPVVGLQGMRKVVVHALHGRDGMEVAHKIRQVPSVAHRHAFNVGLSFYDDQHFFGFLRKRERRAHQQHAETHHDQSHQRPLGKVCHRKLVPMFTDGAGGAQIRRRGTV